MRLKFLVSIRYSRPSLRSASDTGFNNMLSIMTKGYKTVCHKPKLDLQEQDSFIGLTPTAS